MAQAPYLLHHPKMMQQMSYPSSRLKHQKTDNSKFVATLFHVYPPAFLRNVVAEIVATFLMVFVTRGAASLRTKDDHKVSPLGASVAGGLIVTVMIYAVGHISGAHMNPAVTLAFAAVGHFLWTQVTSAVATE